MRIFNSLTREVEEFEPIKPPRVGMYTCGPTVYDYTHIGHGRKYVNDDVLRRTLNYLGYKVELVMNVTDVGHLVSDADTGEDKMEKGAKKLGKTVWEVANFYFGYFKKAMGLLNILSPDVYCRATEHVPEQIELVKKLVDKGFAYDTPEAVYFDVTKFSNYDKLFGQRLEDKLTGAREEVVEGEDKKSPRDFALWFKRIGRFADHSMHWPSPWGEGFPGWHIECSAMSMKYLGEQFDIHTGGEDHLPIHHPNEIAQSEAATGKVPFVKYWVHHAFLMIEGKKMSKSLRNFIRVEDVVGKGFDPLALRYLYLTTHYRKTQNFTWEALGGAQTALFRLRQMVAGWEEPEISPVEIHGASVRIRTSGCAEFEEKFKAVIEDDLNMPEALAVVWEMVKSDYPGKSKKQSILKFDEILGLGLKDEKTQRIKESKQIPNEIQKLLEEREKLRKERKFGEADKVREEIEKMGYVVEDTPEGVKLITP